MSRLQIVQSIQRMICTGCGAEANASCNCGVSYIPAGERAAEIVKLNPDKSNRQLAKESGLSEATVRRARKPSASNDAVEQPEDDNQDDSQNISVEHYRSALVIHSEQAADLAEMFSATLKKSPSAITAEAIVGVRRAANAWKLLASQVGAENEN